MYTSKSPAQLVEGSISLDMSTVDAFTLLLTRDWENSRRIFSTCKDYNIRCSGDDIFHYLLKQYPDINYNVFYGKVVVMYGDGFHIRFRASMVDTESRNPRYNEDITFTGTEEAVKLMITEFEEHFRDVMIPVNHQVSMVINTANGLNHIQLPVKTDRVLVPEMYPIISDVDEYINGFLNSTANVLILMGPPGLGKSALINEIINRANVATSIVFDEAVMRNEMLYTDFINKALGDDGGLMIMEDSDNILRDRETFNNDMMSRLLNISDGIVNTAGAKFVFSANIQNKADIDTALTRPGRCYDITEFRNLTREEAEIAAAKIGRELVDNKNEYSVAEIYNAQSNRKTKHKVGFI
jgi:hypothetical protein